MNPLDWLLAGILLYSIVRAAIRGLARELFALAGIVVGLVVASWAYASVALYLRGLINSRPLAQFISFLLILCAVMLLAHLIGALVHRTASAVGLSALDRLGGAAFGLIRGVFIAASLLLAVIAFLPTAPWVQNSLLSPYLLRGAHAVSFVMPRHLKVQLFEGIDHLKHTAPDWINHGSSSHTGM